MNKQKQPQPIRDPKMIAMHPAVKPTKVIDHADLFSDDFDMSQYTIAAESFVAKARFVVQKYEENEQIIARAELETQDLLHEIHLLPPVNVPAGYRYYRRLREVQTARRQAKQENDLMAPLYRFAKTRPEIVGELKHLSDILKDAEGKVGSYKYTYRIQD